MDQAGICCSDAVPGGGGAQKPTALGEREAAYWLGRGRDRGKGREGTGPALVTLYISQGIEYIFLGYRQGEGKVTLVVLNLNVL
jgi:hypothetical protein